MSGSINRQMMMLSDELESEVQSALQRMVDENWIARIWDHDAKLWSSDAEDAAEIRNRLGWLPLPTRVLPKAAMLTDFAGAAREDFDRVVLLGMGGSSLAPWCFSDILGSRDGFPALHVLDSTVPEEVSSATGDTLLGRCLFIVSSKSGTTTETRSFFDYFWAGVSQILGESAGANFIVITDPDTPLVRLGEERGVRATFENWQDIGGRYSGLSYFGMAPAALIGAPIKRMLERASTMAGACAPEVPADENPGAALGAMLGCCHEIGRDKVTFVTSPGIASFGDWTEQLLAESTGKRGRGLVPVVNEPPLPPDAYGDDRVFVYIRNEEDETHDALIDGVTAAGHPVARIDVSDPRSIGAEMYRWEFATAVAGALMEINPFDQPNVQGAKDKTREVLEQYAQTGELPEQEPDVVEGAIGSGNVRGAIADLLGGIERGDYFAIMAYLPETDVVDDTVARMRAEVGAGKGVATTFGYGPRFLHSTGQLHKGGPNTGVFLQITAEGGASVDVPDAPYDFATLKNAQAAGDLAVLQEHDRRVMRVDLGDDIAGNLGRLMEMIVEAV